MRFALIAGEASGDLLGAELVESLRRRFPQASFCGVVGPNMRQAGCEALADIERLSVMGLAEVLPKLPDILRLRRELLRHLSSEPVDVVIGIDAPDFNLPLERRLRRAGLTTAHVVSPSVWAWRQGRVKSISESVDLMLCLFPFEPAFYQKNSLRAGFRAVFIGHPLAETLAAPVSREQARRDLGLSADASVLAVLPGSRSGELKYLAEPFAAAAARLTASMPALQFPELQFVVPLAKPSLRPVFEAAIAAQAPSVRWHLVDGHSRAAMRAADAVLLASGTATLECLLLDRPMVVAYRASRMTAALLRLFGLIKIERYSLPNLLCERAVVPELIQEQATADNIASAVRLLLTDSKARDEQILAFAPVREVLRRDAADRAASAIAELLGQVPA